MDINKMVYSNGKIPSFDVCRSGNKDLVENIEVEHGADINKKKKNMVGHLHLMYVWK